MAGELAVTLRYNFPETTGGKALGAQAQDVLTNGIIELTDGEGLLHARHLPQLRPLLACWTRCYAIGEALGKHALQRDGRTQYEWLVRQAIRLTRSDGTQTMSCDPTGAWCPDLFDLALNHSDDPDDEQAASKCLPGHRSRAAGRFDELPEPEVHSEWAELTLMRSNWQRSAERLVVAHADGKVRGEIEAGGQVICSGAWNSTVQIDGNLIYPADEWEVLCWFSDEDGDYLELGAECEGNWAWQRQFYLARKDRFAFFADVVLGPQHAQIDYRCSLPLGDEMLYSPDEEATEGFVVTQRGQPRAHVFPLALPEWRRDRRVGSLSHADGKLTLHQEAKAQRLYAPLWIDLDPGRMGKPITWRQLTVAENLERVSPEVAVGYRVQVGKKHWLVYRSLSHRANRTVLGQNLTTECLIARFRRDGTTETLVEIE